MQRRALKRFVELTLVLHACMAALVLVDAVRNDRDKRWALGTLTGGLLGTLPYLAVGAVRSRLPADPVDAADLGADADGYEDVGGVDVDTA